MRIITLLCLVLVTDALSETREKKVLERYTGQSTEQLIALASDYRIDSLVAAFEQAIEQKDASKRKLTQPEVDVFAIEAMEREVNNGGFHQFFVNSSKVYATTLPAALNRIGCPQAAEIAANALACLKIQGEVTEAKIDAALKRLGPKAVADLGTVDSRYFENKEPIGDRLFVYIQANKAEIVLK